MKTIFFTAALAVLSAAFYEPTGNDYPDPPDNWPGNLITWYKFVDCTDKPGNGGDWGCDSCYFDALGQWPETYGYHVVTKGLLNYEYNGDTLIDITIRPENVQAWNKLPAKERERLLNCY